jgi:hypothetical protein
VAIGYLASGLNAQSVSIGFRTTGGAISIGDNNANAASNGQIIGEGNTITHASSWRNTIFGTGITIQGVNANQDNIIFGQNIDIGTASGNGGASHNVVFSTGEGGVEDQADYNIAFGDAVNVYSGVQNSVVLGRSSSIRESAQQSVAIGYFARVGQSANGAIAIGDTARIGDTTTGTAITGSVAIGMDATIFDGNDNAVAIGRLAEVGDSGDVAADYGVAIGYNTSVQDSYNVAIGRDTVAAGLTNPQCVIGNATYPLALNLSSFIYMTEISDPGNTPSNACRLYCRDNGGGKSQLVVVFSTGAVQVLATEP